MIDVPMHWLGVAFFLVISVSVRLSAYYAIFSWQIDVFIYSFLVKSKRAKYVTSDVQCVQYHETLQRHDSSFLHVCCRKLSVDLAHL